MSEICNCGRPCVGRVVQASTFQKHRRLQKCFQAIEEVDLSWLRRGRSSRATTHRRRSDSHLPHEPQSAPTSNVDPESQNGAGGGGIDEVSLLQAITRQLVCADTAIRLITIDHLVLEQHRGRHRLLHGHPKNAPFELHEENLSMILLRLAQVLPTDPGIVELRSSMIDWAQGLQAHLNLLRNGAISRELRSQNERGRHLHTQNTDHFHQREIRASPLVLACLAVVATLFLFFNLSRLQAGHIAKLLEGVVNTAYEQVGKEHRIKPARFSLQAHNINSALRVLGLEPEIISYVCCPRPSCCALYKPSQDGSYPELCTTLVGGVECGYRLRTTCTSLSGKPFHKAHRMYHTQSIPAALGRILSRPGIEDCLEEYVEDTFSRALPQLRDIWHGSAMSQIPWETPPDPESRELRLVFSLTIDWFNAHNSSQRGKSWSVGGVYLTILNLPPQLRHLPENMILVGLIPGPNKPSGVALQNFVDLLVDELVILWEHGIYLTRTFKYRVGRLIRAALGPLVCDLDAVRPILGVAGHSHSKPCSICWITKQQVQQRDVSFTWRRRTREEHARLASEYESLGEVQRDAHWKLHGIRPAALQRLAYWDHLVWTVVDPMHNWLLGVLSHHICDIYGLKPNAKGRRLPLDDYDPEANPGDGIYAYCILRHPNVTQQRLSKLRLPTLRTLAGRLSINAAKKTKKQLAVEFIAWKSRQRRLPDLSDEELELVFRWLKSPVPVSQWSRAIGKDDLYMLFYHVSPTDVFIQHLEHSFTTVVDRIELALGADRLEGTGVGRPMGDRPRYAQPAVGEDELREIRQDRNLTIFPSWLPRGPEKFGAAAHGTLSANEARTSGLYHLLLTLTRLWGMKPNASVERCRLKNFLHLVEACDLATRHSTFQSRWLAVRHHSKTYLTLLKELFPTINGTPNEHLILHQAELLSRFGPSRGWWSFVPERFNGVIQSTASNNLIGNQMELGQLRRLLTVEEFRSALQSDFWASSLSHLKQALEGSISGDYNGTLLSEATQDWRQLLQVEVDHPAVVVRGPWLVPLQALRAETWTHVKALRWESASFKACKQTWDGHPHKRVRNSLVLVEILGEARPAVIRCIATLSPGNELDQVWVVVQCFKPLSQQDRKYDPYQCNSVRLHAANRFDRFQMRYAEIEEPIAVHARGLVCHVGYTPIQGPSAPAAVFTVLQRD